jgi:hypothetical protein
MILCFYIFTEILSINKYEQFLGSYSITPEDGHLRLKRSGYALSVILMYPL